MHPWGLGTIVSQPITGMSDMLYTSLIPTAQLAAPIGTHVAVLMFPCTMHAVAHCCNQLTYFGAQRLPLHTRCVSTLHPPPSPLSS
jgi:hypothetical protein